MLNILDIKLKRINRTSYNINISYKISNEYFENIFLFKNLEILLKKYFRINIYTRNSYLSILAFLFKSREILLKNIFG